MRRWQLCVSCRLAQSSSWSSGPVADEAEIRCALFVWLQAKKERQGLANVHRDQLLWFARALDPGVPCLESVEELHKLVYQYLDRHTPELEQEKTARRPGRPKSKLQERLEQAQEIESSTYANSGMGALQFAGLHAVCRLPEFYHD